MFKSLLLVIKLVRLVLASINECLYNFFKHYTKLQIKDCIFLIIISVILYYWLLVEWDINFMNLIYHNLAINRFYTTIDILTKIHGVNYASLDMINCLQQDLEFLKMFWLKNEYSLKMWFIDFLSEYYRIINIKISRSVEFYKTYLNSNIIVSLEYLKFQFIDILWNGGIDLNSLNSIKNKSIKEYEMNKHLFDIIEQPVKNFNYNEIICFNLNNNLNYSVNNHFPLYKSIVLITLTAWQYWWWMSFIFIITLFNKIFLKLILSDNTKINPKVHTSIKSNGRWGDLVASVFPIFWCTNILINSNFILKLTENHTETGVFTLRVRGKQWYWVYKTSVHLYSDITNMSVLIGHDQPIDVQNFKIDMKDLNQIFHKKKFFKKVKNYKVLQKWSEKRFTVWFLNAMTNSTNTNENQFKKDLLVLKPLIKNYFKIIKITPKRNMFLSKFLEKDNFFKSYSFAHRVIFLNVNNNPKFNNLIPEINKANSSLVDVNNYKNDFYFNSNKNRFKLLNLLLNKLYLHKFKFIDFKNTNLNCKNYKNLVNLQTSLKNNLVHNFSKLSEFKQKQNNLLFRFYLDVLKTYYVDIENQFNHRIIFYRTETSFFNNIAENNIFEQLDFNTNMQKVVKNLTKVDLIVNFLKNNITDMKNQKYNKYHYEMPMPKLRLLETVTFGNDTIEDELFYIQVIDPDWYKPYNRHFFTVQQQPVSVWNFNKKLKVISINNKQYSIKNIKLNNRSVFENQKILSSVKFKLSLIQLYKDLESLKKIKFHYSINNSTIKYILNSNFNYNINFLLKTIPYEKNNIDLLNFNFRCLSYNINFTTPYKTVSNDAIYRLINIYCSKYVVMKVNKNLIKLFSYNKPYVSLNSDKLNKYVYSKFFFKNRLKLTLVDKKLHNFLIKPKLINSKLNFNKNDFSHFSNSSFTGRQILNKLRQNVYTKNQLFTKLILENFHIKKFNKVEIVTTEKKIHLKPINEFLKKKMLSKNRLISCHNALLVPIKMNITVVTNSFDVVHSWFIPGLGIKFDCVPGRSTHYTFRIDKPGVYFGHCAEICGRFHHHMPIKIIAVPLNQFVYYYNLYYPDNKSQNK